MTQESEGKQIGNQVRARRTDCNRIDDEEETSWGDKLISLFSLSFSNSFFDLNGTETKLNKKKEQETDSISWNGPPTTNLLIQRSIHEIL